MHDEWVSEGKREADVVMQDTDEDVELPLDIQRLALKKVLPGSQAYQDLLQRVTIPSTELERHTGAVNAVAYHPSGDQLASGSDDHRVRLWDTTTGQQLHELQGHTGVVWAVAYHPLGDQLASGSDDGTVRLWDTTTGQQTQKLQGHTGVVWAVAYHPSGDQLASGSADKTVRLWNTIIGQQTHELRGHPGWVWAVAYHPSGDQLASGSADNTVRLWDFRVFNAVKKWFLNGCPSMELPDPSNKYAKITASPVRLFALIQKLLFSQQETQSFSTRFFAVIKKFLPLQQDDQSEEDTDTIALSKTEIVHWACLPKEVQEALIDRVKKKKGVPVTYGQSLLDGAPDSSL